MRLVALLFVILSPLCAQANETVPQIVVTGTGQASAEPDMATVFLGVAREARTASAAMAEANEAAASVLGTLQQAGIAPRDVQTASINLSPVWDQSNAQPRQIRGYVASNDLTVRVRDLDGLGTLLDKVVGDGANRLNGLSFAIAETGELEDAARAAAVADARNKAETLATAAGVGLGAVLTISEGGGLAQPSPMMRGTMMEAAVPIAAGEVDVRVSVTVVYSIKDGSE